MKPHQLLLNRSSKSAWQCYLPILATISAPSRFMVLREYKTLRWASKLWSGVLQPAFKVGPDKALQLAMTLSDYLCCFPHKLLLAWLAWL